MTAFVRPAVSGCFPPHLLMSYTTGMRNTLRKISSVGLFVILTACGGGGGGSGGGGNVQPTPTPTPVGPTRQQLLDASRFSARATLGLTHEEIEALAGMGHEAWLELQFLAPIERHLSVVDNLLQRLADGEFDEANNPDNLRFVFRRYAWWHQAVQANDALRQRIAFALSEIFVVSEVGNLEGFPRALPQYYDQLLENAFGNFRVLLRAVTLSPAMGTYLSHLNNRKADPANNVFPDENYAREVMQLFSIGLFELNTDGSQKTDANGDSIPTYTNPVIREFAKIYTGLSFGGEPANFGRQFPKNYIEPMVMFEAFHETSEKNLLNGLVVPAGQTGMQDIEDALDNLFLHPNVGPFIGKQLIQRLVTSNPSADYIERVANAFNDNGNGERGDMKALIRAVLLDPEAVAPANTHQGFGKLREPLLRLVATLRQFNVQNDSGEYYNAGYYVQNVLKQHALASPSVFNFFLPAHSPSGEIAEANMVAPEFQITTSTTVMAVTNLADLMVIGGSLSDVQAPPFSTATLNLNEYNQIASDVSMLIDRLDVVLTYGTLSPETRSAIEDALNGIADLDFRAKFAIYLFLVSPDYAVQI